MDLPDSFLIKSNTGIFQMMLIKKTLLSKQYEGVANGFVCTMSISNNGRYRSEVSINRNSWTQGPIKLKGMSGTLKNVIDSVSDWIDDNIWDFLSENTEDDVRYLDTSNGKIAYYVFNEHLDSTPVMFIHGGPGDGAGLTRLRKLHLAHPVITYDQLGCGRSDPIKDPSKWNHENYFKELNEIINILGFRKVIIIGGSWGAGLAAGYAVRFGCSRIELMILPSPFFSSKKWEEDQMKNLSDMGALYQNEMKDYINGKGTRDNYKHVMSEYYARYLFATERNREIAVSAGMTEQNDVFKSMWGPNDFICTGTMRDFNIVNELEDIDVPVLLVCGDSDEVRLETMYEYNNLIKNSRLSIIPFAGHVIGHDQPELYDETIRSFLREYES